MKKFEEFYARNVWKLALNTTLPVIQINLLFYIIDSGKKRNFSYISLE